MPLHRSSSSSSMMQSSASLVVPRTRRSSSVWDYEQSLMFGQYREDLANFALTEARKLQHLREDSSRKQLKQQQSAKQREALRKVRRWPFWRWLRAFCQFGGDLVFFATLAITLAILSFVMDQIVHQFMHFRHFLIHDITDIFALNYAFWILYMLVLVLISATITRYFSPQAAGSGVSEMKVILRGVTLKEYLSMKTLFTKLVGETFTLASGIYLGKEGPFVHISAMVANQFMKIFYNISDPQIYESRFLEIIAVACGVGVAVSFASPVGGVLYSIEIVSVFFSVRSYWHGFTAATIGALLWRLLPVWFGQQEVVEPLFKTTFRYDYPYETCELLAFAFLGFICGLAAYAYISLNRWFVLFNRRKNCVNTFLQKYPLLYPIIVTVGVGLMTFPGALGQFYTSWLTHDEAIRELFSNYTWFPLQNSVDRDSIVDNWHTAHTTVFENTLLFSIMNIVLIAICTTLPIPGGIIVPSFKIGAGFGRFYGEGMAYLFPEGLMARFNRTEYPIMAGTYALVGSAAFAGANTGAMSSAVIACEMTGQIVSIFPIIVATLVSTITARYFGPAIYDSLIILKNLPYLPPILPSTSAGHQIFVEDFCEKSLFYVWRKCTYRHLKEMLVAKQKLRFFPFVRSPKSMILLGTIERSELQLLLESHLTKQQTIAELRQSKIELRKRTDTMGSRFTVSTIHEEEEEGHYQEKSAEQMESKSEEEELLDVQVDFSSCPIDPAPFQLTEGTSLIKAHNLFSLLGLQLTYVTALGALIGVISLKELGKAIDNLNQNDKEPELPEPTDQGESLEAISDDDEEDDNVNHLKNGSDVEKGKNVVTKK